MRLTLHGNIPPPPNVPLITTRGHTLPHTRTVHYPKLILGALLTGILGLSVHVLMLQGLHVPYPAGFPHTGLGTWLNTAPSVFGAILIYTLASSTFRHRPFLIRSLALFLLLTMLQELFFRAPIMDSVVTTAWTYSFLSNVPRLLVWLLLTILIVATAPLLKNLALKIIASILLYATVFLAAKPLVDHASAPLLNHLSYLSHDEVYALPYGLHVLIPAYLTYAEPVIACLIIAALIWDNLTPRLPIRLLQFTLIILLVRHVLFAPIIFPFYAKMPIHTALLSMGQFTFEAITLAVLSALTWNFSRLPGAPSVTALGHGWDSHAAKPIPPNN